MARDHAVVRTSPDAVAFRPDTRAQLLDVAERLFAERGIDAVSLSEILATAGQRNKSAIYYHFDNKEGLISAIAERRSHALNERRSQLIEEVRTAGDVSNVHAIARTLVMPLAELLDDPGNYYLGFLARYHLDRSRRQLVESVDPQVTSSYRAAGRLLRSVAGLPNVDFDTRYGLILDMIFTALAGRQAAERTNSQRLPGRRVFIDNLVECVAGAFGRPTAG
jgi:AcrR family transcriptional regulator